MLDIEMVLSLLLLGSFVGVVAGLLGVGGGGIMVPVLTTLFVSQGVPTEQVVHLALGTSMAAIIFTSFSSMKSHHARGSVAWDIVKGITAGVIIGTFFATFIASQINSLYLALFFSCFMAFVSVQMFISKKPQANKQISGKKEVFFVGSGIGAVSALVSIGGGSLTVPYLVSRNIDIKKAVGTSAAIGLPISIAGSVGYLVNGWSSSSVDNYTLGFIYLPAVFLIAVSSYLTAPYGAKLAHRLPVQTLKKIFSLLLITLSIKMLSTII
ncbi:UPF0721 transmembrane protein [Psychromonas marina]|uniref:Probable membrane transporter protein n=1 Tax=Psychromonas marina TaxID=88364 RepID=A0ABQ6E1U6_9GAMM|nr:sulfite exporter TauE/SafE family protein [Psychromonas marina]GLS91417.1 UPF0721 transmembrane protein [Psychromonas marina]